MKDAELTLRLYSLGFWDPNDVAVQVRRHVEMGGRANGK